MAGSVVHYYNKAPNAAGTLGASFGDARPAPVPHRGDNVVMRRDTYLLGYVVDAELQADRQRAKAVRTRSWKRKSKLLNVYDGAFAKLSGYSGHSLS